MFLETHALQHLYVYAVLVFEAMATFVGQISVLSLIALFGAATTAMVSQRAFRLISTQRYTHSTAMHAHHTSIKTMSHSAGDDGEEGGDAAAVLPDLHQAPDGAARHGAPPDNHGYRAQARAGEQRRRSAPQAKKVERSYDDDDKKRVIRELEEEEEETALV